MCRACSYPTYDGEPTCRDYTAADAELFRHDATKPRRDLPSLEELAAGFAPTYQCTYIGCTDVAVQGHVCVRHERRTA